MPQTALLAKPTSVSEVRSDSSRCGATANPIRTRTPTRIDSADSPLNATRLALTNHRMMGFLRRIASRFNDAGVPLMALKGAALNLVLFERPDDRPMSDLDLLIRIDDVERAFELLEAAGALRGEPLVREDFFPRYHYESEFVAGRIAPVRIDLHVRPFRPLRYARVIPESALWERADSVTFGGAYVLVPSSEEMLIHLAAHSAIHGNGRMLWLQDIRRWILARESQIDWDRFLETASRWRLIHAVREALRKTENELGPVLPDDVRDRLAGMRTGWRDRLALRQAPRDADHPVAHVAVNTICTPGPRFVLGYLRANLLPDRAHMADWYGHEHHGWLVCGHALRWLSPLLGRFGQWWRRFRTIEVRNSGIHGVGVFATRNIAGGETVARYGGRRVKRAGMYVAHHSKETGDGERYEITGRLKYLNHSCRPNARLDGFRLVALRPIPAGHEINIDYDPGACDCRKGDQS